MFISSLANSVHNDDELDHLISKFWSTYVPSKLRQVASALNKPSTDGFNTAAESLVGLIESTKQFEQYLAGSRSKKVKGLLRSLQESDNPNRIAVDQLGPWATRRGIECILGRSDSVARSVIKEIRKLDEYDDVFASSNGRSGKRFYRVMRFLEACEAIGRRTVKSVDVEIANNGDFFLDNIV